MKSPLIGLYNCIPEGSIRHWLRLLVVKAGKDLPRRAMVNRGDCVLQVGTPSVEVIHHYLEIVGDKGRVIVLEPETQNFVRLSTDPIISKAQNVSLLQRAAWNKKEILALTVAKHDWDHKISVPSVVHDNDLVENNYTNTEEVQADTIDNILDDLGVKHVDYAEIHVNGAEVEVLRGMTKALDYTTRLHVKGHAVMKESGEPINKQIDQMLRERGFRTIICASTKARSKAVESVWRIRAGDVYGSRK